jgi:hypothetical protein
MGGLKKHIELVANVAIICVSVLLCWTLLTHQSLLRGTSPVKPEPPHQIIGSYLQPFPSHRWSDHQQTLVLATYRL